MSGEDEFQIEKHKKKNMGNSKFWVGNENQLKEYDSDSSKKPDEKIKEIRMHLKKYLELNNVSFLFGAGSSCCLGAPSLRKIPEVIENAIIEHDENNQIYKNFIDLVNLFGDKDYAADDRLDNDDNSIINTPLENFLNYLYGIKFIIDNSNKSDILELKDNLEISQQQLNKIIKEIKSTLFNLMDVGNKDNDNEKSYFNHRTNNGKDKYYFHRKLIKSLLSRSTNLKRPNIFTLNYDLAFENAFDELGVQYIDGFSGFNKRSFKPEVYNYDYFYPGDTTQGKVNKVEKVVKYYKLHGSLTWVKSERSQNNIYGLLEKPIELVRDNLKDEVDNMMIYPTTYKKEYTLDFPYSELFRKFSDKINQQQSVLFCIGYSFNDEHVNDIIYQALSIPSFTLVIVDYNGTDNSEIERLKNLDDPRIIILEGDLLGDFKFFADQILPNIHEVDYNEEIVETLNEVLKDKNN